MPEAGVIAQKALMMVACTIVMYVVLTFVLTLFLNATLAKWRGWEVGGFSEMMVIRDADAFVTGSATNEKMRYLIFRRT